MKLKLHLFLTIVVAIVFANTLNATTYTATTSGQWSTVTWSPAGTPGSGDDVIIPDGITDTINVSFTINNLTVGGGTSGSLRYIGTAAVALVINGNITVNAGATFSPINNALGAGNPGLLHTIDLKGNIRNTWYIYV